MIHCICPSVSSHETARNSSRKIEQAAQERSNELVIDSRNDPKGKPRKHFDREPTTRAGKSTRGFPIPWTKCDLSPSAWHGGFSTTSFVIVTSARWWRAVERAVATVSRSCFGNPENPLGQTNQENHEDYRNEPTTSQGCRLFTAKTPFLKKIKWKTKTTLLLSVVADHATGFLA